VGSLISVRRHARRGYTLIELMVVMLVLGILASIVALSMHTNPDASLKLDATRLADLFALAADEAQVRSRTIVWQADANGYRFLLAGEHGPETIDDEHFRARAWADAPVDATLLSGRTVADQSSGVEIPFTRDGVQAPFTLELHAGETTLALNGDGIGHYNVSKNTQ
jgi:general secretion pathway protein H